MVTTGDAAFYLGSFRSFETVWKLIRLLPGTHTPLFLLPHDSPAGLPTPRVWGRVDWYQEKASAQMLVVFTWFRPRKTFPVFRTLLGGFGFVRKILTVKCRLAWSSLWHPGYP